MSRIEVLRIVNNLYPHQEPIDVLIAEQGGSIQRYVLVESFDGGLSYNLTLVESEQDAIDYWKGSSPDDWFPLLLVDLDTGKSWRGEPIYDCKFSQPWSNVRTHIAKAQEERA